MPKHQKGSIFERCGAFYVRYYVSEIRDGKQVRVQRAERLCGKNDKHYAANAKSVKLKRDEVMLRINSQDSMRANPEEQRISDFWERTYLPFAEENLRPSTVSSYEHIWERYLSRHFGELTLKEYRTHMGSQLLTGLTKKLGRRTLAHIRSLASGQPDLVFPSARVSVFVDSCFFHACPKHCRFPKSNQSYWTAKLVRNRERDRMVTMAHKKLGWKPIRIWEHSIRDRPDACVSKVMAAVLTRTASRQ